jgi:hypothetical protein
MELESLRVATHRRVSRSEMQFLIQRLLLRFETLTRIDRIHGNYLKEYF